MEPGSLMKKLLSLLGAAALGLMSVSCTKIQARMEIKEGNTLYVREQYAEALPHYEKARKIDPGFPELDRLIGYSAIGMYKPDNPSPENEKHADKGIRELQTYLQKRPKDNAAREALINLFLNANRTSQAIRYFEEHLKKNPADINAVRSIAQLYAREGNFEQSLNWYEKIAILKPNDPESHYIYGVVLYEKVAKNPPVDEFGNPNVPAVMELIEKGKTALNRAMELRKDYFDALVYLNLMFRQQAKFEPDLVKAQELVKQADEIRDRAVAISRARKAAAAAAAGK